MNLSPEQFYRRQVLQAYNRMDFSGLGFGSHTPKAVRLDEMFVAPLLTRQRVIREHTPGGSRESTVQEPIRLADALELGNLLITGEPGAGKSTLLRWLAVGVAGSSRSLPPGTKSLPLPLLVEFGRLPETYLRADSQEVIDWQKLLPSFLTAQPLFSEVRPETLARALAAGECVILFDGLDEVAEPSARTRIGRSLGEFAQYTANRLIISSREGGIRESESALLSAFELCRIARFTPGAILQFFRSLYAASVPPAEAERLTLGLYERLQASPQLLDAVSTPLLAAVSALIWSTEGSLPAHRVTLYERYCRILVQDWEQHHTVSYVGRLASVGWDTQLRLLGVVAFQVHSGGRRNGATSAEIVPHLAAALQNEGVCANPAQAKWEAEQFLAALGVRSGLLQRQGADLYGFPHRTFQEYLAARHIATFDLDRCTDLLMGHLHEEWWREVHLLTIGRLGAEGGTGPEPVRLIQALMHAYALPGAPPLPHRGRPARIGRLTSRTNLGRRLAAALEREFEIAGRAYLECARERVGEAEPELFARAQSVIVRMVRDTSHYRGLGTVRTVSVQLLARQPDLVVPMLLGALAAPDWRTREVAGELLGNLSHPTDAVLAGLTRALDDDSIHVRHSAIGAIGRLGRWTEEVVGMLAASLHSGTFEAHAAAESLVALGDSHGEALQLLVGALESDSSLLRWTVEEHLGSARFSACAVARALLPALARTLADYTDVEQSTILTSLGGLSRAEPRVVDVLSEAVRRESADVRLAAALALAFLGSADERCSAELLRGLGSTDAHVRRWSARAAGELVPPPAELVGVLNALLEDADANVRVEAACSLIRRGAASPRGAEAILVQALRGGTSKIRARAAHSLAAIPDVSEKVVRALLYALADGDSLSQEAVEACLVALGKRSPLVPEILEEVIAGDDARQRVSAARLLRETNAPAAAAASLLLARLADTTGADREETIIALGMLGDDRDEVVTAVLRMLGHHERSPFDWLVRSEAAASLGRLGRATEDVVAALCNAVEADPSDAVRREALNSLRHLNLSSGRIFPTLLRALRSPMRLPALRALRGVRVDAAELPTVLPALHECLYDAEEDVRIHAILSLQQVLAGRSLPGYQWMPLAARRIRRRRYARVAAGVTGAAAIVLIAMAAVRWDSADSPFAKTLLIIAGIIAFLASLAQITGWNVLSALRSEVK
jgi:HEAT repeat protein